MNIFFLDFRDPLFSIIVFFALIFIITFFSYWWGRYKRKEDYRHLNKFLKQFHSLPAEDALKDLISQDELSQKSWMLLASSYFQSGNYNKCIEIYQQILHAPSSQNQKEIMYLLGKTYFKAGFLERSKDIFLEILRKHPRTPQALEKLLLVYEYMRDYKAALEVLEPLDALKKDVSLESIYLETLRLLNNSTISIENKKEKILKIYKEKHQLYYMVFEYLFRVDMQLAWKCMDLSKSDRIVDLLWNIPQSDLDFEVIERSVYLKELFTARGEGDYVSRSDVFEFDVLIKLHNTGNATLSFEYICDNCKQVYPFAFQRCSNCHSIDSIGVAYTLVKDYKKDFSEESNSFQ
ncbi:tetratricopeptide repeat protein [Sulfurimonas sp. SAG-AH-194-I05]|nr:tetratricopeptide repeat protein [Sulfurimonas sp. SAG-AH-194-I05]MDF1875346.1 tetratricopeptide repeat protein [Sulfurimonas sp. SAG-AH-194-I05]